MSYIKRMTPELVQAFNSQINLELQASYFYQVLASFCAKQSVGLDGFAKHFNQESLEERSHAQKVIDYQTLRGNQIEFQAIPINSADLWKQVVDNQGGHLLAHKTLAVALELEKKVCDSIYNLSDVASKSHDHHAEEWLEDFLNHQVTSIDELERFLTRVKRVGEADGLDAVDQELLSSED